jgi:hypothetical protein
MKVFAVLFMLIHFSLYGIVSEGYGDEFNYGFGARSHGFGGAYTALADDTSALFWNPAGMSFINKKIVSTSYSQLFSKTFLGDVGIVIPTIEYGTLGFGVIAFVVGGLEKFNEYNVFVDDMRYVHLRLLMGFAYQLKLFPLSIGAGGKIDYIAIGDFNTSSLNFDLGMLFPLINNDVFHWRIGAIVRNILLIAGRRLNDQTEHDHIEVKLGTAWSIDLHKYFSFTIPVDGTYIIHENTFDMSVGGEINLFKYFFMRGGYNYLNGPSVGAGVAYKGIELHYAMHFKSLGLTHNFTLNYSFGDDRRKYATSREREIKQRVEIEYREELRKARDENKRMISEMRTSSLKRIQEIQSNTDAKVKELKDTFEDRLNEAQSEQYKEMDSLLKQKEADINNYQRRLKTLQDESDTLIAEYGEAMKLFSEGKFNKALVIFKKIQAKDPGNKEILKYIKMVEAEQRSVTSYSKEIKELYQKGMTHYLNKEYELAIKVWKQILVKDPYNKLALKGIEKAEINLQKLKKYEK